MQGMIEVNRGAQTGIAASGIGFIVVPDDNERTDYISNCYRTMTVTMNGGYGYGYIGNVKILAEVLQQIKFPISSSERGTAVFWVRESFTGRPIIVGVIPESNYTNLLTEGQGRYTQQVGERDVERFEDAMNGRMNINVVGDSQHPSNIRIKASSGTTDSLIEIVSDGMIRASGNQIESTARQDFKISLKSQQDEDLVTVYADRDKTEYRDQFGTEMTMNSDGVTMNADKVNINTSDSLSLDSGKEPMVLGDTLKGILEDILKAIQHLTVMTPVGASSVPINVAEFIAIQGRLQTILSNKSNLE